MSTHQSAYASVTPPSHAPPPPPPSSLPLAYAPHPHAPPHNHHHIVSTTSGTAALHHVPPQFPQPQHPHSAPSPHLAHNPYPEYNPRASHAPMQQQSQPHQLVQHHQPHQLVQQSQPHQQQPYHQQPYHPQYQQQYHPGAPAPLPPHHSHVHPHHGHAAVSHLQIPLHPQHAVAHHPHAFHAQPPAVPDQPRNNNVNTANAHDNNRDGRRRPSSSRNSAERGTPRRGNNGLQNTFRRLNLDSSTRLRDLAGRIVELSADQHGSRMIQHCIESATPAEMHKLLEEVGEQLYQVMTDVFGNYVIQKLLQYGDGTVQHAIVNGMRGRVPALSMHNYGCRVVQEVLATVTSAELRNIVLKELEAYNVSDLIMDQHANHVIQKCVTSLSPDNLGFVISACERQASAMSRHLYGCRVIQRLIEQCESTQLALVYKNVLDDCASLMKNAYGNYVIQHVLEHGKQEHRDVVMDCVSGNLLTLSQHKFASNVIEKFLRVARADQISSLVAELCRSTALPDGTTAAPLHIMMKDKYANYVIQTLMQFAPRQTQMALLDYIHANREVLRGYNYGKHIVAKAEALRTQRR